MNQTMRMASAGFATIANNTEDETLQEFALSNMHLVKDAIGVYDGLITAVVLASGKKAKAGLRHAGSGEYQNYPPGVIELGIALDAIDLIVNDVVNCIVANA